MKKKKDLRLKDLSYSALLKSQNYKLIDVIWEDGVGWFIFSDNGAAQETLTAFINGDLKGNIKDYDEALKTLRQMLFSNKK
ncbi:hypothetical protein HOB10_00680 [Candidatus Parcubacteria bacterium]|jgi:hypothetical protein|nr:hypothetical protein [Candidatus Parcubacteria bacterium]